MLECSQNKNAARNCLIIVLILGVLLTVILVPISLSHVEYYEYGLQMRKSSGRVDTTVVYGRGRYNVGPDHKFILYQADAHIENLTDFGVFSASMSNESIGLSFNINAVYTYQLIRDEIGELHKELASSYKDVISNRAKEAIKNEAIYITFTEYFRNRTFVENRFRQAVQARWNSTPTMHCVLDQFHLGRIEIPANVAKIQLESKVQNERNDKEKYLQEAQGQRDVTAVAVNKISLEESTILRTADAQANLIRARATADARQIESDAQINGTQLLFDAAGISTQDHMTAFTYIRTLANRPDVELDVSYLSQDNVVRTTVV